MTQHCVRHDLHCPPPAHLYRRFFRCRRWSWHDLYLPPPAHLHRADSSDVGTGRGGHLVHGHLWLQLGSMGRPAAGEI